jgi:hypothetical protein
MRLYERPSNLFLNLRYGGQALVSRMLPESGGSRHFALVDAAAGVRIAA